MKTMLSTGAVVVISAACAHGAGLDRSGQSTGWLFNENGTAGMSLAFVTPSLTGSDALGNRYDVGESYTQLSFNYTGKLNDRFALGIGYDTPFGANITYGGAPAASRLGGTMADLTSDAVSVLGKFQVTDRFSVFGGARIQAVRADVALNGQAYAAAIATAGVADTVPGLDAATLGAALQGDVGSITFIETTYGAGTTAALGAAVLNTSNAFLTPRAGDGHTGYSVKIQDDQAVGFTLGIAYEIPDIALRFALTYHSEIEHEADTLENLLAGVNVPGTVTYKSPQSVNLDFQTGIAPDTLLLASYRWTEFSTTDVVPATLGADIVSLDDTQRFSLGLGRRFSEAVSGSVSFSYEPWTDDATVSALGPTDGLFGVSLGGRYSTENLNISGGVNYSWLGSANAGVAGVTEASFTQNRSLAVGFNVKFTF